MLNRTALLGLAVAGLFIITPASPSFAESPLANVVGAATSSTLAVADKPDKDDDEKGGEKKGDEKEGKEKDEDHEGKPKKEKEIEQAVPLNMVPQAVIDAVKKEVPGGTITEAELEAKKGKIMYGFDVKTADAAYDVNITVDGKFYSKKIDDDRDEDDKKPEAPEKK